MAELECRQLSRSFGPVRALEGVTLAAEPGRILGLLGPNGSGKTTLIKLANGLLRPSGGEILVCGAAPGPETRAQVSYMPERLCLPEWMSVERIAAFYADFYADFDAARAGELLARLGIDGKRRLRQLSKGARQKVQLALVMSRRARLYLLDEPFGSHDQQQAEQGQQVAPRRGKFVFEQLSQHLNTSRKRASTLLPSRSRSCAAGEASFTMPRSRNTTSSRMRSTSEMMCVEITIAASGGRQAVIVSSMKSREAGSRLPKGSSRR